MLNKLIRINECKGYIWSKCVSFCQHAALKSHKKFVILKHWFLSDISEKLYRLLCADNVEFLPYENDDGLQIICHKCSKYPNYSQKTVH